VTLRPKNAAVRLAQWANGSLALRRGGADVSRWQSAATVRIAGRGTIWLRILPWIAAFLAAIVAA
jgi:hypothetical protein